MSTRKRVYWGLAVAAVLGFASVPFLGEEERVPSYTIDDRDGVLEVRITGFEGPVDDILAAFRSCQEGSCSCPTDEYENLESLDVETTGGTITLRLTPKPAAQFDRSNVARCLDFTLRESAGPGTHGHG